MIDARGDIFGRARERAALTALLDDANGEALAMAWVEGEPGIGKTRMLDEVAGAAAERGFAVYRAQADELDALRPFSVVGDALGLRRERPEEYLDAIDELTGEAHVALLLDDLQWADPSSLLVLSLLARSLQELPMLVVGALRGLPRRPELHQLLASTRGRGAVHLPLAPLATADSEALAAAVAGAPIGPGLRERVSACGGNPLFVSELIAALTAEGELRTDPGGEADVDPGGVPRSLALTVLSRLGLLPGEVVDVLHQAAVAGSTFSVVDLSLITKRSTAEIWPLLRDALAAGMLEERGDRLAFRHDVVREALDADLPAAVRASMHLDTGRALAAAGADAGRVAGHMRRGAQPGDREAVAWLERAAGEAAPRGAVEAATLLESALEIADVDDPARGRLTTALAFALIAARRHEEGEELARRSLEDRLHPEGEAALRLCLAQSLMGRGLLMEALTEAALAEQAGGLSAADRARVLCWQAVVPLFMRDQDALVETGEKARAAAAAAGATDAVVRSLVLLGCAAGYRAEYSEQERSFREATELAQAAGTIEAHEAHPHLMFVLALADLDDPEAAERALAAGRRAYNRLGDEIGLKMAQHMAGYALVWQGRWLQALTEFERAAAEAQGWQVDVLAGHALLLARLGQLNEALEVIATSRAEMAAGAPEYRLGWTDWAEALVKDSSGDAEGALGLLWSAWESVGEVGLAGEQRLFAPDLARMLAAAGDSERGAEVATLAERLAEGNPDLPALAALSLRCRGLAARNPRMLAESAAAYRETNRPHERALACEDAAVALAHADGEGDAVALAGEALELYAELGAVRDAARVRARLREAGVRLGTRAPHRRATSGWEALTPAELRVAELMAEGLSNPEIAERLVVSRHTVVTHVSKVLAKLGLRSRLEVATAHAVRGER